MKDSNKDSVILQGNYRRQDGTACPNMRLLGISGYPTLPTDLDGSETRRNIGEMIRVYSPDLVLVDGISRHDLASNVRQLSLFPTLRDQLKKCLREFRGKKALLGESFRTFLGLALSDDDYNLLEKLERGEMDDLNAVLKHLKDSLNFDSAPLLGAMEGAKETGAGLVSLVDLEGIENIDLKHIEQAFAKFDTTGLRFKVDLTYRHRICDFEWLSVRGPELTESQKGTHMTRLQKAVASTEIREGGEPLLARMRRKMALLAIESRSYDETTELKALLLEMVPINRRGNMVGTVHYIVSPDKTRNLLEAVLKVSGRSKRTLAIVDSLHAQHGLFELSHS